MLVHIINSITFNSRLKQDIKLKQNYIKMLTLYILNITLNLNSILMLLLITMNVKVNKLKLDSYA